MALGKTKRPKAQKAAKTSSKRGEAKAPVKAKINLKIVDFNNTLNWGGTVPADFQRRPKAAEVRHLLKYRMNLINRDPSRNPDDEYVSFYVSADWDPVQVATEFMRFWGGARVVTATRYGSRIVFDVPSRYVAVIHTISSRNYGNGAIIPHEPVSNTARLRVLKSADELTYLEVWTTD